MIFEEFHKRICQEMPDLWKINPAIFRLFWESSKISEFTEGRLLEPGVVAWLHRETEPVKPENIIPIPLEENESCKECDLPKHYLK